MSDHNDYLLYAISAWREMSWPAFKRTFDTLYVRYRASETAEDSLTHYRRRTIQILDALGHCDMDFSTGSGRVHVAPPLLARLPASGLPQAVLCGARSLQMLNRLVEINKTFGQKLLVRLQVQDNRRAYVSRRVTVEAESIELLSDFAQQLRIGFTEAPPAWGIVHFSGSLHEYLDSCQWETLQEITWQRRDFDPELLQFRACSVDESDFRLSSYDEPVRIGLMKHFLWRNGVGAEVDRDWGRYAILHSRQQSILAYDAKNMKFAVPSHAPLPRLFARALALCSGYAPHFVEKSQLAIASPEQYGFDIFTSVSPDIAEMVASKLGQNLLKIQL